MPPCLRRKLVFGDREQINALRDIERHHKEIEEREKEIAEGRLSKYRVSMSWTCEIAVDVWAENESEAKEIAKDENEPDSSDFDLDRIYAFKLSN